MSGDTRVSIVPRPIFLRKVEKRPGKDCIWVRFQFVQIQRIPMIINTKGVRSGTYSVIVTVFPCHEQRLASYLSFIYELVKCCLLCLTASLVGPMLLP